MHNSGMRDSDSPTDATSAQCRLATPGDAEMLVSLIRSAYRGEASRAGWTSEAEWVEGDRIDAEQVREIIEGDHSSMLIIADGGETVGCCQIADLGHGTAYLGTFAVKPGVQGRGFGRKLIDHAQRQIAERFAASQLEIVVLVQQQKLIDWYRRLGFVPTGASRAFQADARFARPLRDDLYFVVLAKELAAGPVDR